MKTQLAIPIAKGNGGSSLIIALLTLSTLSLVGATVLMNLNSRYNYTQKAVGWEAALSAAEAGADYGFANCRWTIGTGGTSPWNNWKKFDSTTSTWITVTNSSDANNQLVAGNKIIYDLPSGSHLVSGGQGTADLWYHVEVDSPGSLIVSGNRWYRIRATGYAALTGQARANNDSPDGARTHNDMLRKFDLRIDHFIKRYGDYAHAAGTSVPVTPQATRRIEVIAQPTTPFGKAFVVMGTTGNPLEAPLVDSYDSTDTLNYPGGLYNSGSRNPHTGTGTNATVYVNAPISSYSGTLYGNLETNGGSATKTNNISGTVTNTASINVPPVTAPSWKVTASSPAPSVITAGTTSSPSYGSYTSINDLTVVLPVGQTQGVANIYVTGNVQGGITVSPGVTLKIWFEGDFSMKARDIQNLNYNSSNLQFYGIDPPAGQSRSFDIGSGNPGFRYFSLDAPAYDFSVNGNPDFCGSFIVKTLSGNGNTTWHYDEALATVGLVTAYQRAMWVEDER